MQQKLGTLVSLLHGERIMILCMWCTKCEIICSWSLKFGATRNLCGEMFEIGTLWFTLGGHGSSLERHYGVEWLSTTKRLDPRFWSTI